MIEDNIFDYHPASFESAADSINGVSIHGFRCGGLEPTMASIIKINQDNDKVVSFEQEKTVDRLQK
jgi:hypothetical protein